MYLLTFPVDSSKHRTNYNRRDRRRSISVHYVEGDIYTCWSLVLWSHLIPCCMVGAHEFEINVGSFDWSKVFYRNKRLIEVAKAIFLKKFISNLKYLVTRKYMRSLSRQYRSEYLLVIDVSLMLHGAFVEICTVLFQVYTTPAWCIANWWQGGHQPGQTQNIQTFLYLGKWSLCLMFYCSTVDYYRLAITVTCMIAGKQNYLPYFRVSTFCACLYLTRKHSRKMHTDRAVTRSSSERVSMRPIVDSRHLWKHYLPLRSVTRTGFWKEDNFEDSRVISLKPKVFRFNFNYFVCVCFPDCLLYLLHPHYSLPVKGKSGNIRN